MKQVLTSPLLRLTRPLGQSDPLTLPGVTSPGVCHEFRLVFQMPPGTTSVIVCDPTGTVNCCAVLQSSVDVRGLPPSLTVNIVDGSLAAQVLAIIRVAVCSVLVKVHTTV